MFKDLMGNVFPADWMVMNLVQMQVFLRAINQYSDVLNKLFLDQAHFELQVCAFCVFLFGCCFSVFNLKAVLFFFVFIAAVE